MSSRNSDDHNLDLSLAIGPSAVQSSPSVSQEHRHHFQLRTSPLRSPSSLSAGPSSPPPSPAALSLLPSPFHHFIHPPAVLATDNDCSLFELRHSYGSSTSAGQHAPSRSPLPMFPGDGGNLLEPGNTTGLGQPPHVCQTRGKTKQTADELDSGENEIPQPYPWATKSPARVHTLSYLHSMNISVISGQIQCKRCEKVYTVEYGLQEKFLEVSRYIVENKELFRDRAPSVWMNPQLPTCETCKNSMKPVISEKKEEINWLFLLLGQMLGCCTLEQLRYFCQHTKQHRTGAKDRVLFLTYLALCKQLDPAGPFDRR